MINNFEDFFITKIQNITFENQNIEFLWDNSYEINDIYVPIHLNDLKDEILACGKWAMFFKQIPNRNDLNFYDIKFNLNSKNSIKDTKLNLNFHLNGTFEIENNLTYEMINDL